MHFPKVHWFFFGILVFFTSSSNALPLWVRLIDSVYNMFNFRTNEGTIEDTTVFEKEYDFVVIGAGSGGCVVANRLTEVKNWDVLLLEAGDDEPFFAGMPIAAPMNSITYLNWGYKSDPVPGACLALKDGFCNLPRGKVLGGTSVLNLMVYSRGVKRDYDEWAAMGNTGWSYEEVLPYFKKSENVGIEELKNSPFHGVGGYLDVQESSYYSRGYLQHFKTAAEELGYNYTEVSGDKGICFSPIQANIRDGRRCSASKAFLEPIRQRTNLHVSKNSQATRLLFDPKTKKTFGVEFYKDNKKRIVKARKEVILAAGTYGTAQILMHSGVGPREDLESFGIPVIKDSKVGYNLQDQPTFFGVLFLLNQTTNFLTDIRDPRTVYDYLINGKGALTLPGGAVAMALLKTKYAEDFEDTPDVELVLGIAGLNMENNHLDDFLGLPAEYVNQFIGDAFNVPSISITPILVAPRSRGRLVLKSGNPLSWLSIRPNHFEDVRDLYALREATKMAIKVINTSGFRKLGARLHGRKYPKCEKYDLMSDEHWECAIRQTTSTIQHMSGTAKMGPISDESAVVDPTLKVIGVQGVRVADASIMPNIIRGHTNAPVYMIGEKAADMIKADWLGKSRENIRNIIR